MPTDGLPLCTLLSDTGIGWKVERDNLKMLNQKDMKSLTNGLALMDLIRLLGLDP